MAGNWGIIFVYSCWPTRLVIIELDGPMNMRMGSCCQGQWNSADDLHKFMFHFIPVLGLLLLKLSSDQFSVALEWCRMFRSKKCKWQIGAQTGYGFVHYSLDKEGVLASMLAVEAMNGVVVDGVRFTCSVSKSLSTLVQEPADSRARGVTAWIPHHTNPYPLVILAIPELLHVAWTALSPCIHSIPTKILRRSIENARYIPLLNHILILFNQDKWTNHLNCSSCSETIRIRCLAFSSK